MAVINDPQVNKFVNEQERPACDLFVSLVRTLQQMTASYSAGGLGPLVAGTTALQQSLIADGSSNPDGSKGDGRTPILGYDVDNTVSQANAFLAWLNANPTVLAAFTKPSVNIRPLY